MRETLEHLKYTQHDKRRHVASGAASALVNVENVGEEVRRLPSRLP